jgi:alpha-ketoglutarate-dependent taurine dioxygenase
VLRTERSDDLARWAAEHREDVGAAVSRHGSLLVRGLGLHEAPGVRAVFSGLAVGLMTEREAVAPRTRYAGGLYSATKWPAAQQMCMHHELSYALECPGLLLFACLTAPTSGGATALADAPSVLAALPAELVERFAREGWMLTLPFNTRFGNGDPIDEDVVRLLKSVYAAYTVREQWRDGDLLLVDNVRTAHSREPYSGAREVLVGLADPHREATEEYGQ